MESIYYVVTWLCHRTCQHCYDERFRSYRGAWRGEVVAEAASNFRRIIANLPERMTYVDEADRDAAGAPRQKVGRVILAGGEVLLDEIREAVLYPALDLLHARYRDRGGVQLVIQTTGDHLRAQYLHELAAHHVSVVTVSGIDQYHRGLETEAARAAKQEQLTALFERVGYVPLARGDAAPRGPAPSYLFFGATPGSWIGKLWPRGRAWENGLSRAGIEDNFCAGWSGGRGFLRYGQAGAEVSIEPGGEVYPCCIKTRLPVGNLLHERLEDLLARHRGDPVYEAISRGAPDEMGLERGWSQEQFRARSRVTLPSGQVYENLCIGCDRFHEEVLGAGRPPRLVQLRPSAHQTR